MKHLSIITCICALSFAVGCGTEETADKSAQPNQLFQQTTPSNTQGVSPVMNNGAAQQPANAQPVQQNPAVLPANNTTVVNSGTAAGLNPEHGQPGHRCDIAVGAPLNSKPAAPVTQTAPVVTQAQPATISAPVVNTVASKPVAKGMNPEHGQPGHRCDIAVGAPLDSKPTAAATPSVTTTATPSSPTPMSVTPVLPAAKAPANMPAYQPGAAGSTTGLNPEHGKPGHRCDIAVGAPLNSKPAVKQ